MRRARTCVRAFEGGNLTRRRRRRVFALAHGRHTDGCIDAFLIALDPDGAHLFSERFGGERWTATATRSSRVGSRARWISVAAPKGPGIKELSRIAVSSEGDVLLTGGTAGAGGKRSVFVTWYGS